MLRLSLGVLVSLTCLSDAAAAGDVRWIEDPTVMNALRDQLVETLSKSGKVSKAQRAGNNELRVSGKRLKWGNKKPKPKPPTDQLAAVLAEAGTRDRARRDQLARTPPESIHWTHAGQTGEHNWSRLHPAFSLCAGGKRQSPISIDYAIQVNLPAIEIAYGPTPFFTIDDGRGLMAQLRSSPTMTHRGSTFRLKQIEFHRPAEHAVNGQRADMSAHLVHEANDGTILMLAVSMNVGQMANPAVQRVIDAFPLEPGQRAAAVAPIDAMNLLPEDQRYYEYLGSLTRPPCTEGVRWLMLRQPISIGAGQYEIFESLFPPNARTLQANHARRIKMSR